MLVNSMGWDEKTVGVPPLFLRLAFQAKCHLNEVVGYPCRSGVSNLDDEAADLWDHSMLIVKPWLM